MVSPQAPEVKTNPKFPLFSRLLYESQGSRSTQGQGRYPVCPATAPVLLPSATTLRGSNMDKQIPAIGAEAGDSQDETSHSPIKLLDPPKSKLKRQLSIETAERSEALPVRKRPLLYESRLEKDKSRPRVDEIDGGNPTSAAEIVRIGTSKTTFTTTKKESRQENVPSASDSVKYQSYIPEIVYDKPEVTRDFTHKEYSDMPLKSPNRFNLSDIGLTSPFATRTSLSTHSNEKEVFVFPDSVPPRKTSPYKHLHEENRERELADVKGERSRETFRRAIPEPIYRKELVKESDHRVSHSEAIISTKGEYSSGKFEKLRHSYVTESGFAWPEKPNITESIPFSPRIVTTENRPRFPLASSSSERMLKARDEEELKTRLAVLEREYARAKEIYGSPSPSHSDYRQLSPSSRGVDNLRRSTLRSVSNTDRSPNEKDIREATEEVRNRYERSFSDPRFSPRQLHGLLMRPSPLARQYEEQPHDSLSHDRFTEHWRDDVKRRLFVKGDVAYTSEYRRQHSSQVHTSTEIPDEVLQFLHSRNFHPEELENLKDVLRRGGSPHADEPAPYRGCSQVQFEESRDVYNRYRLEGTSGRRESNYEDEFVRNTPRERQHGDIDVRLSCENVKDKRQKTEDILTELDHDNKDCKCAKIEEEIRKMAMDAYSKIRRADRSAEAHDQFQNELNETNTNVYNSMRVLCGIKCLCKYGRTLDEVFAGSVVFRLNCPNVDALLDLWHMYKSGDLARQMSDAFVTEELLDQYECEEINLKISIDWSAYLTCKSELETNLESSIMRTPTKSPLTPVHTRSRSEPASVTKQANQVLLPKTNLSPFRERFCSDSSVELSPRRAFQELNAGKHPVHPPSPSKKCFTDNVFSEDGPRSPLTSPRRKTFVFRPEKEQENVETGEPCVV